MNFDEFKDVKTFKAAFQDRLEKKYMKDIQDSSNYERYVILGEMIRNRVSDDWKKTEQNIKETKKRITIYFSMEFLMGRMITNNLFNSGLRDIVESAFKDFGFDINDIEHEESDAGLGSGGLGRLAACFLDSAASINLPVYGNCIRYRYGLFEQGIKNGYQIEKPESWLKDVNVWELRKEEEAITVPFYGKVNLFYEDNALKITHTDCEYVSAVPYDVPIIGDNNGVVNVLRLWNSELDTYPLNVDIFEYNKKVTEISSVLYPNDSNDEGKLLRLKQQYFLCCAGVKSAIRSHKKIHGTVKNFHKYFCFQLNDTHPVLVIPELMRILIDEEHLTWEEAWQITRNTCAFTNHTILAEALEKWPIYLFKKLLPRIYMIVEEINRRFCEELLEKYSGNHDKLYRLAIIGNNTVRMANLGIVGSFSVNGVAKLHTEILKNIEMKDFNDLYPEKFNNKTNGITHRRWCYQANPELRKILDEITDKKWVHNPDLIENILSFQDDVKMQKRIKDMKRKRKEALADYIFKTQNIKIDVDSIFDIQVKRLHEYKRQLMNALHIMYVYNRLKTDKEFKANYYPHTFIFGAKAAVSYSLAKKIIKLINTIAVKVNNDNETNHLLKVVFVVNYNVTYAERIMPAADLSEQISTASKEASGTGNMKFMMNGAVTIGTLDGANVEINELVGDENMFLFGMHAEEVTELAKSRIYNPLEIYLNNKDIKMVLDNLDNGFFENVNLYEFTEIKNLLLQRDPYFVLKDFESYKEAHEKANEAYKDEKKWYKMAINNIGKSGFFSTDRTIRQYNKDIWKLEEIKF